MKTKLIDRYWFRRACFLPIILLLLLAGCANHQPPETVRWKSDHAELGTIGVVAAEFEPERVFEGYIRGRLPGAGYGALGGALSYMGTAGYLLPATPVLIPPAAVIGAVDGAVRADSKKVIRANEAEVKRALAALRIQRSLQERVVALARDGSGHSIMQIDDGGPDSPEEIRTYTGMTAAPGADNVLELAVLKIGTNGPWDDKSVALFVMARARLLGVHDEPLLFEGNYEFTSEPHQLAEWCANHAVLLSDAPSRGLDDLAGQIVDELILTIAPGEVPMLQVIEPSGLKITSVEPHFAWEAFPRSGIRPGSALGSPPM
jgi:hypothetical protein